MPTSESLWLLYFTSKSSVVLSPENITFFLLFLCFARLSFALLYWAYPGGHAWGKYYQSWKWKLAVTKTTPCNIIPGPRGVPLVGSMNLMSSMLAHQHLESMADSLEAKRLMAFSLGETRAIVTCNPEVAKEILNSSVFADRPIKQSAYSLMFNQAIGFAPFGLYWRTLRKVSATHLFSPKQISASESQRRKIANQMVSLVASHHDVDHEFEVRDILKRASLNNMMCLVFGREYDLGDSSNEELDELSELVHEGYELLGQLNWADHLPWLASFDLQKIRHRCSKLVPRVNQFVARIISEHRVIHSSNLTCPRNSHFLDVLLSLTEPNYKLSDPDAIAILWEMIFRGTDAIAVLIEWILARVVLHPDIQSKMHEELDKVVGRKQPVEESDVLSLVYLQAVIKEVLRLHPPGPLLSWARLAITDTVIDGHHIPAGTTAMVNIWAIARDPKVWSDPLNFLPERFISSTTATGHVDLEFSVMGSDLRLAPFGSGRRSCPGKTLGLTTVSFWVATLLHEYVWIPADHQRAVNLTEVLKLSCEMAHPLKVKAFPRRTCS